MSIALRRGLLVLLGAVVLVAVPLGCGGGGGGGGPLLFSSDVRIQGSTPLLATPTGPIAQVLIELSGGGSFGPPSGTGGAFLAVSTAPVAGQNLRVTVIQTGVARFAGFFASLPGTPVVDLGRIDERATAIYAVLARLGRQGGVTRSDLLDRADQIAVPTQPGATVDVPGLLAALRGGNPLFQPGLDQLADRLDDPGFPCLVDLVLEESCPDGAFLTALLGLTSLVEANLPVVLPPPPPPPPPTPTPPPPPPTPPPPSPPPPGAPALRVNVDQSGVVFAPASRRDPDVAEFDPSADGARGLVGPVVRTLATGVSIRLDIDPATGLPALGPGSTNPILAPGGQYAVFLSPNGNLTAPPKVTSGNNHLWLRDLVAGTTILLTRRPDATPAISPAGLLVGGYHVTNTAVFFAVDDPMLVGPASPRTMPLYRHDILTGVVTEVVLTDGGTPLDPALFHLWDGSDDGARLLLQLRVPLTLGGVAHGAGALFAWNGLALVPVTYQATGQPGTALDGTLAGPPRMSGGGRYVAYASSEDHEVGGLLGVPPPRMIYRRDIDGGVTAMVSRLDGGSAIPPAGPLDCRAPSISDDGNLVGFVSSGTYDPALPNPAGDKAFLRRLSTAATKTVSFDLTGNPTLAGHALVAPGGGFVLFRQGPSVGGDVLRVPNPVP